MRGNSHWLSRKIWADSNLMRAYESQREGMRVSGQMRARLPKQFADTQLYSCCWREALGDLSVLPKNTSQWPRPALWPANRYATMFPPISHNYDWYYLLIDCSKFMRSECLDSKYAYDRRLPISRLVSAVGDSIFFILIQYWIELREAVNTN